MSKLKDIVPYEANRRDIKILVLDELIAALKESENLSEGIEKFKLRIREW